MAKTMRGVLEAFNEAFSNQRLDDVMGFFADDCEFREMNGHTAKGKAQVRDAIQTIFSGAYGKLSFFENRMIIDEEKKEVCFSWNCQHDMIPSADMSLKDKITAAFIKLVYGQTFYWQGVDYFIFDDDLNITSKQSYGRAAMPKFVRGAAPR
ncbi:nuclear transport factor 2 family protein [Bacterioplanoides sp.]|uniref:nuclear transport factor 2 family protein n=1 Tax=Bacterioplanoides sp. TaxID=2066072 RepID=UPI003B002BCA